MKRIILVIVFITFALCTGTNVRGEINSGETGTALNKEDDKLINILIAQLMDSDPKVRGSAVEQLGKTGKADAAKYLIHILEYDDVWSVRKRAAWALGEIKESKAVGPLIVALKHDDWIVRMNAAEALGKIAHTRAVEPLIEALQDKNSYVYSKVTWALGEICDDRAVGPLIEALGNEMPSIRINAAKALGNIRNSRAVDALITPLRNDRIWEVRKWSAWALGEIGAIRAVEQLIQALNDENYYVRMYAEMALEKIGKPAIPFLAAALNDKRHMLHTRAVWALEGITGEELGSDTENWRTWIIENRESSPDLQ